MQEISSNQGDHPGQALPSRSHFIWLVIMAIVVLVSLLAVTLPARGAAIASSPDGEFLAFSVTAEDGADVWAYEVRGEQLHRVTRGANARHPTWLSGK